MHIACATETALLYIFVGIGMLEVLAALRYVGVVLMLSSLHHAESLLYISYSFILIDSYNYGQLIITAAEVNLQLFKHH